MGYEYILDNRMVCVIQNDQCGLGGIDLKNKKIIARRPVVLQDKNFRLQPSQLKLLDPIQNAAFRLITGAAILAYLPYSQILHHTPTSH